MVCIPVILGLRIADRNALPASTVVITKNGELFKSCSLYEDTTVDTGSNTIVIRNGEAYMGSATCKNHICIRQGHISRAGQMIVCMPNRIVVEIKGGDEAYDAVTR
ncbi:MAG: NusG domain II-containing protein [Lachnospiraceae bacterium]|nr:NusG domain II-containing protein [Lachnospiraceae bacterium]